MLRHVAPDQLITCLLNEQLDYLKVDQTCIEFGTKSKLIRVRHMLLEVLLAANILEVGYLSRILMIWVVWSSKACFPTEILKVINSETCP